jgi:hypothetical protein
MAANGADLAARSIMTPHNAWQLSGYIALQL